MRSVLVASSTPSDAWLAREALAELGLGHLLVDDAVEAMGELCRRPTEHSAVLVGERVGRVSGLTLCGLARDAGCRLPMLLLTGEDCRWNAVRAARLHVTVLWRPTSVQRVARSLLTLLPRRACAMSHPGLETR